MSTSDSTPIPNENLQSIFNTIQSCIEQGNDTNLNKSLHAVAQGFKGIMEYMTTNDERLYDIRDDVAKLDVRFAKIEADIAEIKSWPIRIMKELETNIQSLNQQLSKKP